MTLTTFWDNVYLPWAKRTLQASSLTVKTAAVRKFVLPYLGSLPLSDITEKTVDDWHTTLSELRKDDGSPYSATYLRTIHNQLTAILEKAVEKGLIVVNPAISLGSLGDHDARRVVYWSAAEYMAFIVKVEDRMMRLIYNLAFWCSLRRKEILSLRPSDVSDDGCVLSISMPRPVNPGWTGSPVVLSSPFEIRKVDVPVFMRDDIREARDRAVSEKTTLFPFSKEALSESLSAASDNAGLRRIGFDGLRDSSIRLMIEAGFSPSDIAEHVGMSLQALERRFSPFFAERTGLSERLVDYVVGKGLGKTGDDGGKQPARVMTRKSRIAKTGKAVSGKPIPRITPSNAKDGLHTTAYLDMMPIRMFATWCGFRENARKRLGATGLSMLKLINADEKVLRDVYHLPAAVVERLQEAFRAFGVEKGIRRDELHGMGRYTFRDFEGFRNYQGL